MTKKKANKHAQRSAQLKTIFTKRINGHEAVMEFLSFRNLSGQHSSLLSVEGVNAILAAIGMKSVL